ncbi:hypothetical protein ASG04_13435 [Curtobacterium sp. Leaf183]|uniref:DUF4232 domain-containing protein n=1 Tax=Curtobacterium sp. Leaf183 TaxID=1736291 RepID=UPI0006F5904E|nr:DUF4232 domain-containing protein [Curtobacterium sp. Leaf183]KQS08130.1 hypothetical protein ASG04_13435 [Curtobacterium sp. Leaf183]
MTPSKTLALASAAGIATLIALSGCAANGSVTAEPTTATTTAATPATHVSTASGTASPTTGSSAAGGSGTGSSGTGGSGTGGDSLRTGACATTDLAGSVTSTPGGGAAGHQGYELVFRNTGSKPCTLQGWPGVSFVGKGNGTQLGAAASFDRASPHGTVTIAAGSIAHATVIVAQAGDFGDCGATTADGFRVYPPGSKQSLFIDAGQLQLSACTNTQDTQLEVQAIQPGS